MSGLKRLSSPRVEPHGRPLVKSATQASLDHANRRRNSVTNMMQALSTLDKLDRDVRLLPLKGGSKITGSGPTMGDRRASFNNNAKQRSTVGLSPLRDDAGKLKSAASMIDLRRATMQDVAALKRAGVRARRASLERDDLEKRLSGVAAKKERAQRRARRREDEPIQIFWLTAMNLIGGTMALNAAFCKYVLFGPDAPRRKSCG